MATAAAVLRRRCLRLFLTTAGSSVLALAIKVDGPPGAEDYYWHKRGGTYVGHGAVPFDPPMDFSKGPAWTWDNPDDELFRHGPVIDGEKNLYVGTSCGWIRKFSPDGVVLWSWRTTAEEGKVVTSPFLHQGRLFLSSMGPENSGERGLVHCLDMETGERLWAVPVPHRGIEGQDSRTVHVAEGVLLGGAALQREGETLDPTGGTNSIYAVNASDGRSLWQYTLPEGVIWNFMPSTPGDGTFFFATTCGGAQRRRLLDGSSVWEGAVREPAPGSCGTGGGTLGPNGVFYSLANHFRKSGEPLPPLPGVPPCTFDAACSEGWGLMTAYRAEDGKLLWGRRFGRRFGGMQYPTVGMIGDRMAVVAGIGQNPALPEYLMGPQFLPLVVRLGLSKLQVRWWWLRRLMLTPEKYNGVIALDPSTGETLWLWEEAPWEYYAAAGDEETFHTRVERVQQDPRMEPICGPDNWGIPAVTADGTVIIGSGSTGNLYAIRDSNKDGVIQDSEVSTFMTGIGFLNGPALAPGLMAVAPCWGKMYVFTSDSR